MYKRQLLDFSKAFDKVQRKHLLLKLYFNGIRGKTERWTEDFLSTRSQQVVVKDEHSYTGSV